MKRIIDKFLAWYNARFTRKVFIIAVAGGLLCLLIGQFEPSGTFRYIAFALLITAIGASAGETLEDQREFKRSIEEIRFKNNIFKPKVFDCFTPQERRFIKRKKQAYLGTFLFKAVLIIILIALLVGLL